MNVDDLKEKILLLEKEVNGKHDNGVYGIIVDRYIVCGKSGCKCRKGKKHGPYPHIQVYDKNKKLHGVYIGNKKKEIYERKMEENKDFFNNIKELNKLYLLRKNIK